MVTGYEVSEDGTLQEVELTKDDLDATKVVCVDDVNNFLTTKQRAFTFGKASKRGFVRSSLVQESQPI